MPGDFEISRDLLNEEYIQIYPSNLMHASQVTNSYRNVNEANLFKSW